MSIVDRVRSFAEARCEDHELSGCLFSYGDMRELLHLLEKIPISKEFNEGIEKEGGVNVKPSMPPPPPPRGQGGKELKPVRRLFKKEVFYRDSK